jgi:hypothetical protein
MQSDISTSLDSSLLNVQTEPRQQNLSRQDAKAQRKRSSYFSELGILCVFARDILPSVLTKNFISPKFQLSLARIEPAEDHNF